MARGKKSTPGAPVRFTPEQRAYIVQFVHTTTSKTPWSDLARILGLHPKERFRVRDEWTEKLNPKLYLGPLVPEAKLVLWRSLILSDTYKQGPSGTVEWKRLKADSPILQRYPKTKLRNYYSQWKDRSSTCVEYASVKRAMQMAQPSLAATALIAPAQVRMPAQPFMAPMHHQPLQVPSIYPSSWLPAEGAFARAGVSPAESSHHHCEWSVGSAVSVPRSEDTHTTPATWHCSPSIPAGTLELGAPADTRLGTVDSSPCRGTKRARLPESQPPILPHSKRVAQSHCSIAV